MFSKPFPVDQDARSTDEKIMDDIKYFVSRHMTYDDPYFNEERGIYIIPLENVLPFVHDVADLNGLRTVAQKEFAINDHDCIEHELIESSDEHSDVDDDNDDAGGGQQNQQHCDIDDESWD